MKNEEIQTQYIYRLIDPRTKSVVYIGKTKNLKKRFNDHKRLRKNKYETRLEIWKNDLIKSGGIPIMEVITECDISHVDELEKFYIRSYRESGFDILNSTDGGDGLQNPSEETRRKIGLKSKGRKHSEETIRKISESCYLDQYDGDFLKFFKKKSKSKKVLLIKNNEYFTFDNLSESSKKTNIHKSTICGYISGKVLPRDKSIWKYIL
jgi:group I intron endonuclease